MKDDQNRITVAQWNMLKPYLRIEPEEGMTPTFGDVVDEFRKTWEVYISVTPVTLDSALVYKYRYEVFRLSGNNIEDQFTGSDHAYYLAMRNAIQKAFEFISDLELTSEE